MATAARGLWQSIVETKRLYLNPHEHFGRANICRAAAFTYVGLFVLWKCRSNRKAKALKLEQEAQRKNAALDAIARAGLA